MIGNNKAQSTLEYAVIIFVVVAALVAMQIFMKRSVEGKVRTSTDEIGQQFDPLKTGVTLHRERTAKTVQRVSNKVTNVFSGNTDGLGSKPEKVKEYSTEDVGVGVK